MNSSILLNLQYFVLRYILCIVYITGISTIEPYIDTQKLLKLNYSILNFYLFIF